MFFFNSVFCILHSLRASAATGSNQGQRNRVNPTFCMLHSDTKFLNLNYVRPFLGDAAFRRHNKIQMLLPTLVDFHITAFDCLYTDKKNLFMNLTLLVFLTRQLINNHSSIRLTGFYLGKP